MADLYSSVCTTRRAAVCVIGPALLNTAPEKRIVRVGVAAHRGIAFDDADAVHTFFTATLRDRAARSINT